MYDKLHRVAVNSGYAAIIQANQLKRMRNRDGKKKSSARLRSWPRCNWLQFFLFIFVSDVQVFFFFYICALPFRSSVAIFFSSTANHLCHPYESMMNYRRPHYYAPVFFQFKQIHCHVFAISAGAKSDEYHSIWFYEWNSASS